MVYVRYHHLRFVNVLCFSHFFFFFPLKSPANGTKLHRDVSWMILNIICDFCFIYKLMAVGPILISDWLKFQQLYSMTPHVQLLYDRNVILSSQVFCWSESQDGYWVPPKDIAWQDPMWNILKNKWAFSWNIFVSSIIWNRRQRYVEVILVMVWR